MKKIRNWCKKHTSEIFVGVICTIITTIFFNVCAVIKEIGPTAGISLFRFFSNYYFTTLSKTTETSVLSLLFSTMVGIGTAYVMELVNKGITLSRKIIKDGNEIISLMNSDKERIESSDKTKITPKEIESEAKDIIKQGKKVRIITTLCAVFFVFCLIHIVVFTMLPDIMWREYQRDITKISPYIEQQELDIIKSDWVCMQSKKDYDDIYKRINKVKDEYKLP